MGSKCKGRGIAQGLQRNAARVESPLVCTSAARKTGETPCARGERRSLVRVFAVAVVFVVVFGAAGYKLAGSGSVVNPRRRCRRGVLG